MIIPPVNNWSVRLTFFLFGLRLGFLIILFSFLVGVSLNDIPFISLNGELSTGELLQVLATIFAALYIPFILEKKINNKRSEKGMLIDTCDKLEMVLKENEELLEDLYMRHVNQAKAPLTKVIKLTGKIKIASSTLKLLLKCMDKYSKEKSIDELLEKLKDHQYNYWDKTTPSLVGNKPKITRSIYNSSIKILYVYLTTLSQLKMKINDQ